MLERKVVVTQGAPKPIGPYSVGIRCGAWVYLSGQLGLDPATNEMVPGGVEAETRRSLQNLVAALEASGASMASVVKTTVFMRDMAEFARMNAVYGEFFTANPPARSTVQVAALPRNGAVEIDCVALAE
jgi:2-iminobutanoate/2-iminopropanoate deaminase